MDRPCHTGRGEVLGGEICEKTKHHGAAARGGITLRRHLSLHLIQLAALNRATCAACQ
jgi:hypothetical protein